MNGTIAPDCTCPSGDGSLRHPCPAHPFVPAITNEQAIKLARAAAYSHCNQHSYLPQTWEAAATWQPHEWVVSAIVVAADTAAPADTWFADQLTAMGEVIPFATTPSTRGIDPTDPWRGLYAPELMPKLDGVKDWSAVHPDLPQWPNPEDEERALDPLVTAQGFAFAVVDGDYGDDAMSVEFDTCAWLAAWEPEPPAGDHWRLVMVQDTEDGPAAVYVRPLALIDASPKGGSTDVPVGFMYRVHLKGRKDGVHWSEVTKEEFEKLATHEGETYWVERATLHAQATSAEVGA